MITRLRAGPTLALVCGPKPNRAPLQLEPQALADLASSEMGVSPDLAREQLVSLCLAVQGHLAARKLAGWWGYIEVDSLLDEWRRSHACHDLWELLSSWVHLLPFLAHSGLLCPQICGRYIEQTQGWLCERIDEGEHAVQLLQITYRFRAAEDSPPCGG